MAQRVAAKGRLVVSPKMFDRHSDGGRCGYAPVVTCLGRIGLCADRRLFLGGAGVGPLPGALFVSFECVGQVFGVSESSQLEDGKLRRRKEKRKNKKGDRQLKYSVEKEQSRNGAPRVVLSLPFRSFCLLSPFLH